MNEAQSVQMHLGFLTLKEVLPLVRMKRSNWYAKQKLGLVPEGQPHPFAEGKRIYTVEEIDKLLRRMEADRKREGRAAA